MTSSPSRAEHELAAVLADLPELSRTDPQGRQTAGVLVELAQAWPGPLGERDRKDLEALCREIAVRGNVFRVYERDWNKVAGADGLRPAWWPLLIAVLLAWSQAGEDGDPDARGLGLKSLNAALGALDMADSRRDVAHLLALRSWCEEILEGVSCEVGG